MADLGADPMRAGQSFTTIGWALALVWLAGAGLALVSVVGVDALREAGPVEALALALMTLTPAFLILFAAAAAREGARGRAHAAMLADAARELHNPSPAAEAAARRMGVSVRGEIAALDRALDHVSQKLREVEAVIARQTLAVDNAAAAAEAGARHMVTGLERERNDLLQIADDLHNQARLIGEAISRHTKMIADAARLAEAEVRAADEALDARLSSFGAAAALIADRTHALNGAAQESAEAALRLEGVLAGSLDALAKASSLTDAARQSAEAATLAANSTAGAVRETTQRAVEEARRAAEYIRAEAANITGGAQPASARAPSEAPRDAGRRTPSSFLSGGPATTVASPRPGDPGFADSLAAPTRATPPSRPAPPPTPNGAAGGGAPGGLPGEKWTWRDVLASIDDEESDGRDPAATASQAPQRPQEPPRRPGSAQPAPSSERRAAAPNRFDLKAAYDRLSPAGSDRGDLDRLAAERAGASERPAAAAAPAERAPARPAPAAPSSAPGMAVLDAAGVRLADAFTLAALDRISQKARGGTQARRRAVREAAPEVVLRLANHLDADARARKEAADFLAKDGARIAELLGRGRASMSADATRAFLLVDAAAS